MISALRRTWARWRPLLGFSGSENYWRDRYRRGGDSGAGSGGSPARHKADVLNAFVEKFHVRSVIEFGCGDGRQLMLSRYADYSGYDISQQAVDRCRALFAGDGSKRFALVDDYCGERAELGISLDVLFHLVEDKVYDAYLERLFAASTAFVAIYTSDEATPTKTLPHVRHRHVSRDISRKFQEFEQLDFPLGKDDPLPATEAVQMKFFFYRRLGA
jgi:SAM-dependent methyltransferase